MQSLVSRLEQRGLHTYRDISDLRGHIVSIQSRIDISLVAISKSLVVLHDRIENIAQSQETLKNLVNAHLEQKEVLPEMNLQGDSQKMPVMESEELPDSQNPTQVRSTSVDITCSETIGPSRLQEIDQELQSDGFMEFLEWEKVEELMNNYQKHM